MRRNAESEITYWNVSETTGACGAIDVNILDRDDAYAYARWLCTQHEPRIWDQDERVEPGSKEVKVEGSSVSLVWRIEKRHVERTKERREIIGPDGEVYHRDVDVEGPPGDWVYARSDRYHLWIETETIEIFDPPPEATEVGCG